ncbi:hypothetical protein D8Y22_16195 [Salinadaptatus halalkaliphilus]|uniref:Uncharacterized protein n=1 Tax=Salinadaptatus halalkaliphilus TaxID=2419781 RepID=A0A4S3TIH6_9EURY|nr:hypothetical protein [Salinadaptatus halalkaliphilus]THE63864.1 hypothetical protein D8Y22_16195 [Salinadaptatus halalkaliphilus]
MSGSNVESDEPDRDGESVASSRGPVVDRLSTVVAVVGFLVLATNDAPPLADIGLPTVFLACLAVGTLVGLASYRVVGPQVRPPLWLGVVTAVALSVPILVVLLLTGSYTAERGWAVSLGCAMFGLGATVRAIRAQQRAEPA